MLLNPYRYGPVGPTDPYWANVVSGLHMDGANGSTSFPDEKGKVWTRTGSTTISTAQSKFGGASARFNGADYIQTPPSTDFDLGNTYTIDFWVRPDSLAGNFGLLHRGFYNTSNNTWTGLQFSMRHLSGALRFYFYGSTFANEQRVDINDGASGLQVGVWKHIAMVRSGITGYVFVDGVQGALISSLSTSASSSEPTNIGIWNFSSGIEYFTGYIDDVRITKGVARWLTNFTPPTLAFPNQ